jgi:hypothetical protein
MDPAGPGRRDLGLRGPGGRRDLPGAAADAEGHPGPVSLELPYIKRNIEATNAAYNLNNVEVKQFAADTQCLASDRAQSSATLNNIRLWDPDSSITLQTFERQQAIKSYYTFPRSAWTATPSTGR